MKKNNLTQRKMTLITLNDFQLSKMTVDDGNEASLP